MKKVIAYLVLLILVMASLSSCGKKLLPSKVNGKAVKGYDAAAFDYFYVEAIKQKLIGNSGDALKYLEQCVKIDPKSDAAYYQMAQIIIASGNIANGKKFAAMAVSIDEKNIWYLMMLSGIYYQEKNLDSAIIYYEKAVKYFPENENLQLTLGNLYTENKNYSKANSIFDTFDKKYGVNEASTLSSVKNLLAERSYDEALVKIQSLLSQYPDEMLYNGLLAEIYRGMGKSDKALEVYKKLLERNPDNPQAQLSLCDFLISEKSYNDMFVLLNSIITNKEVKREDKIGLFGRLIEIPELVKDKSDKLSIALLMLETNYNGDEIIPLLRVDLLIRQEKLQDAELRLEDIIKVIPDNYYAWEKLLLVYLQRGEFKKLMTRGEECATRFNMSYLAKVLYANGALENGNYTVALDELKKAEILAGNDKDSIIQVLTMRADVYYRMKEYAKSFEVFDQAIKYNKNDLTVINNYAYYLAEQNQKLKEAEEMAKKVIETEKNNNTYLDTYGWVLYKRGKLNEAAKVMEQIINSGGKPEAAYYEHYGFILKKQKKCPKAIENWNIALKLDSTKTNLINEIKNCEK